MDKNDPEFLPTMVGILARLQMTSSDRGYKMLACFLDMAREEVEDQLKHEAELAALATKLRQTSSRGTWRGGDFAVVGEESVAA